MIDELRLASPWVLWLALPALACAWAMARRRRKRDARVVLPAASVALGLGRSPWQWLDRTIPWIRGAILLLGVLALARPQAGTRIETVTTYGVDVVMALDVSTSMSAEDFRPDNRLAVAKRTIREFVDGRPDDRIGLVVFAGLAVTRCPLTVDHAMLRQFLDEVEFAERDEDGTALGMGLAAAVNRLKRSDAKSRVAVLVTDGRNNRGEIGPRAAADAAEALGVRVYAVGVGTEGEAPVPVDYGPLGKRYRMQQLDLDEELLRDVAARTGGRYFRATDPEGLAEIFKTIDKLEPTRRESRVRTLHTELFGLVLAPMLLLGGFERAALATRLRRIP